MNQRLSAVSSALRASGPHALASAAVATAILQASHITLRGRSWVFDTTEAMDAYLFSMIFFGPAAAGIAAWHGRRYSQTRWLSRARPSHAIVSLLGPVMVVIVGVFLLGALVTILIARVATAAPVALEDGRALDLLVAVVGVIGFTAGGFAIGARRPSVLIPAAAAGSAFAWSIFMWMVATPVAQFGGGPTGGRGFSLGSQTLRLTIYAGLTLMSLGLLRARTARIGRVTLSVGAIALFGGVATAFAAPIEQFADRPLPLRCAGAAPRMCVATRSERYLDDLVDLVSEPGVREVHAFMNTVPGARTGQITLAFPHWAFDMRAVRDDPSARAEAVGYLRYTVATHSVPPLCRSDDRDALDNLDDVARTTVDLIFTWLRAAIVDADGWDRELRLKEQLWLLNGHAPPTLPPPSPSLRDPGARDWLARSIAPLPSCV